MKPLSTTQEKLSILLFRQKALWNYTKEYDFFLKIYDVGHLIVIWLKNSFSHIFLPIFLQI